MLWNFRSFYPSLSFHPFSFPLAQNKESLDIIQDKAIKRQESKEYIHRTVNNRRLSRVRCFTVPGLPHYKLGTVLLIWIPVPLWETKAKIYYPIEKEFSTKDKKKEGDDEEEGEVVQGRGWLDQEPHWEVWRWPQLAGIVQHFRFVILNPITNHFELLR